MTVSRKEKREEKLHEALFKTKVWKEAGVVGLTISMPFEINTGPILERAFLEGKEVAVARVESKTEMAFYRYQKGERLVKSSYGILEPDSQTSKRLVPSEIDLLIVPGLAFNEKNQRVGFGGGYFDRYLTDFKQVSVSLAFSFQLRSDWESDLLDLPVDEIIKEEIYEEN